VYFHDVMEQLLLVDLWLHRSAVCSGCRSRFITIDTRLISQTVGFGTHWD